MYKTFCLEINIRLIMAIAVKENSNLHWVEMSWEHYSFCVRSVEICVSNADRCRDSFNNIESKKCKIFIVHRFSSLIAPIMMQTQLLWHWCKHNYYNTDANTTIIVLMQTGESWGSIHGYFIYSPQQKHIP